jgi:hypothetical protein
MVSRRVLKALLVVVTAVLLGLGLLHIPCTGEMRLRDAAQHASFEQFDIASLSPHHPASFVLDVLNDTITTIVRGSSLATAAGRKCTTDLAQCTPSNMPEVAIECAADGCFAEFGDTVEGSCQSVASRDEAKVDGFIGQCAVVFSASSAIALSGSAVVLQRTEDGSAFCLDISSAYPTCGHLDADELQQAVGLTASVYDAYRFDAITKHAAITGVACATAVCAWLSSPV